MGRLFSMYAGALRIAIAGCACVVFGLSGCTAVNAPPDVTADSSLVDVLTDLYLLEGRVRFDGAATHLPNRDSLLAAHGLTEAAFIERMNTYREHPEAFYDLQKEVLERLNLERLDLPIAD
ncbi:MAG: hypothetical protein RhofKO_15280 [Rhodothermales bacterium]